MLQSYFGGKWQAGSGEGAALVNPTTGDTLATASSKGLDLKAALEYSRNVGGPELRKLTYGQRAELLGKIADALAARRDEWFEIARKNSGNTKADALIDVDGSIGTLKYLRQDWRQAGRCPPATRRSAYATGARREFSGTARGSAARPESRSTSTPSIFRLGDCGRKPRSACWPAFRYWLSLRLRPRGWRRRW